MKDALAHYVAIHDRIFQQQATLGSIFRNLFGRGPDFAELLDKARSADELCSAVQDHVAMCYNTFQDNFTPEQHDFFGAMIPYVEALKRTTALLYRRQEALRAKSQGLPFTLSAYHQIEREYEHSVEDYMRLAAVLQPRTEKLFERKTA
ncbi:MAG: hypothetical protein IH623_13935 [Verrucomicrobia bacterium]|nr:hypothetical protein [Verrucomicrobiota bacterium]